MKKQKNSRYLDIQFSWMTKKLGAQWSDWQKYAASWFALQTRALDPKRIAISFFVEHYLSQCAPYAFHLPHFFLGSNGHISSSEELVDLMKKRGIEDLNEQSRRPNYICDFIDYIIEINFSTINNSGIKTPNVVNPFRKVKVKSNTTETVRSPLPFKYILELREILCPSIKYEDKASTIGRHFNDWRWYQKLTGKRISSGRSGDWFEVDEELVDKTDPDCVWREVTKSVGNRKVKVYQIWSPVRALILFIKLHLPLRAYQIKMLDSGEADTFRYESGNWILNENHDFARGNEKKPFSKGVFKKMFDRITNSHSTGLYINTNKTTDQHVYSQDIGYTIPWQNEEVLYWLEKLRNWQEKYNKIQCPTNCKSLHKKHTESSKSKEQLDAMGSICFLFRDASGIGDDRIKPIDLHSLKRPWYALLLHLENIIYSRGETLENGSRLRLVHDYSSTTNKGATTLFPIHSLRVGLITAYCLDSQLPIPVVSKLLAGHSRIMTTIYYNKLTPSVMAKKMSDAESELVEHSSESLRHFLNDASESQVMRQVAYNDESGLLNTISNRLPIAWESKAYGVCLAGGSSSKTDEISTLAGCWNGGELIIDKERAASRVYGSVPNGPENCVRCRWFVTDVRYLNQLNGLFNQRSYLAHESAKLAAQIEIELEDLKDERYFAELEDKPFLKIEKFKELQRRYEKQKVESDEFTKDWIACFNLIKRIMEIEEKRAFGDHKGKIVAVGDKSDIIPRLKFIETNSELFQLSLLCEDAEFYPDLRDTLSKTPVLQKRSMSLCKALVKSGSMPVFLEMDEKQQLLVGNALMREMAKALVPNDKVAGFKIVADYLEAERYLLDAKLLKRGIKIYNHASISFKDIS
ncbi:VPA1269 family protein [Pseudoalteromonas piscicida]|uniref:Integrase n=1 Tax=Pseudoalteromonas piscicida TaxID=43662 RepID=A0ABM6NML0_PSEO7|nr:VPA1269 family protein [Pseudoalteromonas piscicida]ATD10234.1 hypothetical protein PPIS_b1228 [Pseudoalteromonas piscicida]WPU32075.1 VPA1269 family protein [Pseudoalteromonas piscicida]